MGKFPTEWGEQLLKIKNKINEFNIDEKLKDSIIERIDSCFSVATSKINKEELSQTCSEYFKFFGEDIARINQDIENLEKKPQPFVSQQNNNHTDRLFKEPKMLPEPPYKPYSLCYWKC